MTKENTVISRHVVETLAERIQQGVYQPGARLPAERELAAEFALDRSIVRAVLSELTRTGLIVREPGCRPRVSPTLGARSAGRPTSSRELSSLKTIAVILPQHQADHGSREIIRGISHVLRSQEAPYRPLIFDTNLRTAPRDVLEQEACDAVASEGIAGAIVWPTLEVGSLHGWRSVQEQGHPVVFIDRYDEEMPCDFVGVDNYAAAKEATDYLLRLGHTRIVHLTLDWAATSIQQRTAGFQDALKAVGLSVTAESIWMLPNENSFQGLDEFVTWLLETDQPPTAIFAVHDQIAHALIARLEAQGKTVPGNFSVLGFDDEDQYSARPALLTTVRQPFERIGQRAAELLLRRLGIMSSPPAFQHILLSTALVERSTCRSLE